MNKILAGWDVTAAQLLHINWRADGSLYVVNGHHRAQGAWRLGVPRVLCLVMAVAPQQEPAAFRSLNTKLRGIAPSQRDLFHARLVEGDPRALKIEAISSEAALPLSLPGKSGVIQAFGDVETIFAGRGNVERPDLLQSTLQVIYQAWVDGHDLSVSDTQARCAGKVLRGIATFLRTYDQFPLDRRHLVRRLRTLGFPAFHSKANGKREALGHIGDQIAVALVLEEVYNYRLRAGQLPNFLQTMKGL